MFFRNFIVSNVCKKKGFISTLFSVVQLYQHQTYFDRNVTTLVRCKIRSYAAHLANMAGCLTDSYCNIPYLARVVIGI